jgi:60 kDa SS-A/Ro ribonucleoprotein
LGCGGPAIEAREQMQAKELATADAGEVQLSAGADKKETFERLIRERRLGYFALIRNLRNMGRAGVDVQLVREAILARKGGAEKLLPLLHRRRPACKAVRAAAR